MRKLDDAVAKIRDRSSLYWMFYDPDELEDTDTIEVRLDCHSRLASEFQPPSGWDLHRIQGNDSFYIRRQQSTSESNIEEMLCEMLNFASAKGMKFHSWQAGSANLTPDHFHL